MTIVPQDNGDTVLTGAVIDQAANETAEAFRYIGQGHARGKVIVTV